MRRWRWAVVAAALLAGACTAGVREARPFEGVWQSMGYGFYLVVGDGLVQIYEHTSAACLPVSSESARGISEIAALEYGALVLNDRGRVIRFTPLGGLPDRCHEEPDPGDTLAVAAASIEELHPSWEARDPQWVVRRDAMLAAPHPADPGALLTALRALLEPLGDPQVRLAVSDETILPEGRWSADPPAEETVRLLEWVGGSFAERDGIYWGRLPQGPGYLMITRLGSAASDPQESERRLAVALDRALEEMDDTPSLILDLRTLRDGTESAALLVASRFIPHTTEVGSSAVRLDRAGRYGDPVPLTVNPLPGGVYRGALFVLVGADTAGPGELLALSLESVPGATLVGAATAGSPSPILVRALPNGWSLGLPYLSVRDPEGRLIEPTGIEPDVAVPRAPGEEDGQLARAVELATG